MSPQQAITYPDAIRSQTRTTAPDFGPLSDWATPGFQNVWLGIQTNITKSLAETVPASLIVSVSPHSDTASTSTLLDFGRQSSHNISAARAFAQSLLARARSINEWIEDSEYESQFEEVVESVSPTWLKTLARFKSGPEIVVSWGEDDNDSPPTTARKVPPS